ncbi:MAG: ATP-binding protein [Planctomycetia bacterium]
MEEASEALLHVAAGSLLQVLTNLVQNACVHAFEGVESARSVRLSARLEPQRLVLRVADNGQGMTPEVAARAHEPFFTTRRGSGGSGLGLAIVHNIVAERFGGTLHLETAPGAGTCWTLVLPLGTPALARPAGAAGAGGTASA